MVDVGFTIIMQWVNFGILLFLLYAFGYKPLLAFLDRRSKKIADDIDEALANKEKSMEKLSEYEEKLKDIRHEADALFSEARRKGEDERKKIIESAEVEARNVIQSAREEIAREIDKARAHLKQDISAMVIQCTSKVLEREVNEQDHKKTIEEFLQS